MMMTQPVTVTLRHESGDAILNRDVLAVAQDVVRACANAVSVDPPLGAKPFVVQQANDGKPRACLNWLPNEYVVNVTCLHTRQYARLAFQLGHEIGHFYVDPRISNWFVESVCTAISFLTLDVLAHKWTTTPPFPNWCGYASSFTQYRQKTVADAVVTLGIPGPQNMPAWIAQSLAGVVATGYFGRTEEMLCAYAVLSIMKRHPCSVSAITRLGAACSNGTTDFTAWQQTVSESEAPFVAGLAQVFAHGFRGAEESNKTPEHAHSKAAVDGDL